MKQRNFLSASDGPVDFVAIIVDGDKVYPVDIHVYPQKLADHLGAKALRSKHGKSIVIGGAVTLKVSK